MDRSVWESYEGPGGTGEVSAEGEDVCGAMLGPGEEVGETR